MTTLSIPDDVLAQFPELIDLIKGSESMNDEERQYWVNILPIMTPDQLSSLKDILVNEKTQLKTLDEKYAKDMKNVNEQDLLKAIEEQRKQKRSERSNKENTFEQKDAAEEESILREIENN